MRLNEFEKHIANNIDNYPSELDTESLWATLESDLDEKRRRRIIIIILLGILCLLPITCFVYYQWQMPENVTTAKKAAIIENGKNAAEEDISCLPNVNQTVEAQVDLNTTTQSKLVTKSSNQQLTKQETPITNKRNRYSEKGAKYSSVKNTSPDQLIDLPKAVSEVKAEANLEMEPAINEPATSEVKAESDLENLEQQLAINEIATKTETIDEIKDIDPLILPKLAPFDITNDLVTEVEIPEGNNGAWSLYLKPTIGIYHTNRQLTAKNQDGITLKDLRDGSEKTLETLSFGMGMELKHKSNFFLSAGINLNQLTEQFDDQRSEFATSEIEIVTEINYLATGEREEVLGTFEQSHEIISNRRIYNTLRWTEWQVGGGYSFTKNRWTIGARVGLLWGTGLKGEGKILDAGNNIFEIKNDESVIYKNNLGLGAYANLEMNYALHPRLSLSAQLGYKRMSSSFAVADYPLDINYQWLGAAVGLRIRIN